ncbi:hypothetical protein ACQ4LE_007994 [Meloidogyne hapla]
MVVASAWFVVFVSIDFSVEEVASVVASPKLDSEPLRIIGPSISVSWLDSCVDSNPSVPPVAIVVANVELARLSLGISEVSFSPSCAIPNNFGSVSGEVLDSKFSSFSFSCIAPSPTDPSPSRLVLLASFSSISFIVDPNSDGYVDSFIPSPLEIVDVSSFVVLVKLESILTFPITANVDIVVVSWVVTKGPKPGLLVV